MRGVGSPVAGGTAEKGACMEKIRLPFLGPGWFEQARAAGAVRDEAGWYLPPHAVIPAALQAKIDAARSDKKRHISSPGVCAEIAPVEPVPFDPELLEIIAGMPEGDHRSRVIADFYQAKIAEIKASRQDPLAWAYRALEDPSADPYTLQLAREALGR